MIENRAGSIASHAVPRPTVARHGRSNSTATWEFLEAAFAKNHALIGRVEGGYLLSGQWDFVSGIHHTDEFTLSQQTPRTGA